MDTFDNHAYRTDQNHNATDHHPASFFLEEFPRIAHGKFRFRIVAFFAFFFVHASDAPTIFHRTPHVEPQLKLLTAIRQGQ
jgi:hypothetical protein